MKKYLSPFHDTRGEITTLPHRIAQSSRPLENANAGANVHTWMKRDNNNTFSVNVFEAKYGKTYYLKIIYLE